MNSENKSSDAKGPFLTMRLTAIGSAVAVAIGALSPNFAMADDDKKTSSTATLTNVRAPDQQAPLMTVPDCPAGSGWVGPSGSIPYSHCSAAGPATTTKTSRGMLAQDVCNLNAASGYVWTAASSSCAIPVVVSGGSGGGTVDQGGGGSTDGGWVVNNDSGGGGCFIGSTNIAMAHGSTKPISAIEIGDYVLDAFSGKANKVIGVKKIVYQAGQKLFTPEDGVAPFMTEEHPFYDAHNRLSAISQRCTKLAPWLGDVQIVEVPQIIETMNEMIVYNLMLETGHSHFANGVRVSNIVGTGGAYVLHYKGYLDYEAYVNFTRNPENLTISPKQSIIYFKFIDALTRYVLHHDNVLSHAVAKTTVWGINNRDKVKSWFDVWFQSRVRNAIFTG